MNTRYLMGLVATVCTLSSACAPNLQFPPDLVDKVSPTFQFEAWRDASPSNPSGVSDSGTKVELGGRVVQVSKNGKGIMIVAQQLPIVNSPVYGPTDVQKRVGDFEFALLYPGELESQALRIGNRFIMIGTTSGRKPVVVNGAPKSQPFLVADCIHIWQTGRSEIADFKLGGVGGGYSELPERTYCAAQQK